MASQTFVARDVFSAIWNLGVLGALQAAKPVKFPFDEQLRKFIHERSLILNELLQSVEDVCGFSKEVMSIATESSPWNDREPPVAPYDRDRLAGEILLATHESGWIELDYDDPGTIRSIAQRGKEAQLIAILDGAVQARYCFKGGTTPFAKEVVELLEELIAFGNETDGSKCTTPRRIIQLWLDQHRAIDVMETKDVNAYEFWRTNVAIPELT